MLDLLKKLKENNFLVALNNEVKEWNEHRISKFKLKKYFELIISSCDVGVAKPEREIYEILLDKIKISPEEIIFIDNREENLIPAKNLGIKTHLFKSKKLLVNWLREKGIE